MIDPLDPRSPPMTPQLALRVAIVGSIALVLFALIFFRLWFLQVLTGSQYVADAQRNIIRTVAVAAPRGEILASDGSTLVGSTAVPAVVISPPDLPTPLTYQNFQSDIGQDDALFNRLAKVLRMSTKPRTCKYTIYLAKGPVNHYPKLAQIPCLITQSIANQAYANVTIKTGVTADVQAYLAERQLEFPGVTARQPAYLRTYPYGALGAQMLGTIGPITAPERAVEAKGKGFKGAKATDVVGQTGLEYEYDQYLLGVDGTERVKVNAANQFEGYAKETSPTAGYNLKTSIDIKLQKVGEAALAESIHKNSGAGADGGAFVAMDPENGQVYAMGSYPTYKPSIFTHSLSTKTYNQDFGKNSGSPQVNRAIASALPDGSTFKVITATAALESGKWTTSEIYDDTGQFCYPGEKATVTGACLHNSGNAAYGAVDLEEAIQVSDDDFFYNLGYKLNGGATGSGGDLQIWARRFGIGQTTGIDLPGEASGALPSPDYFKILWREERECETATGPYKGHPKHPAVVIDDQIVSGGCGIASTKYWGVGDNVNTAVGQGDVQVTPVQLAVVYAALANDGTVVTPHIGEDIQSSTGEVLSKVNAPAKRHLSINPGYRATILAGLHAAAQQPGGTSYDVMGNFGMAVYGKTGTAQEGTAAQIASNTESDYAWYVCFVPATATSKPILIVVSVEKGGFGDVAAAPVARQMLSEWFYGKRGPYIDGSSADT
jgi:penicillin-binding protein 2